MDITLYYQSYGSGEPLILLHGNGEDSGYFIHQIDFFAENYHVFTVDTRGHGKSPRGTAPFTIKQFADDLQDFMDEHNLEKAIILGFSDGANIAMKFALYYPERTRALILNAGNLNVWGLEASIRHKIGKRYAKALFRSRKSKREKHILELQRLMLFDPNIRPKALKAIQVPTLVIAGTEDLIKPEHTDLIARSISGSVKMLIPGDHAVAFKNPTAFNRAVDDFLSQTFSTQK
jgi:pimeloyl-ACP methyl ester carboxylesterase